MVTLSRDNPVTRTTPISRCKRVIYHGKSVPCNCTFCRFEKSLPQPEIKCTRRLHLEIPLQSCLVFHSILDLLQKTSFWANLTHPMSFLYLACEQQTFLLALRRWGTFREEERLRLSDRCHTDDVNQCYTINPGVMGFQCKFVQFHVSPSRFW